MLRRFIVVSFLSFFLVAGLGSTALLAQSEELLAARSSFRELYDAGRYKQCEVPALRALELVRQELGSEHIEAAIALTDLANLYRVQYRLAEAEPLLRQALVIVRQQDQSYLTSEIGLLGNLAVIMDLEGRWGEAEAAYRDAIGRAREGLGSDHELVAKGLSNLGGFLNVQGRYDEAEQAYRQSLDIKERTVGSSDPSVAVTLANLAVLYETLGRFEEAEDVNERALEIREEKLGSDHPEVGYSLARLAALYANRGRHKKAEKLYERALKIFEAAFEPPHPEVGRLLFDMAQSLMASQEYARAAELLGQALEIAELVEGPPFPRVPRAQSSLASVYWFQAQAAGSEGRSEDANALYGQAERLYVAALAIQEAALGPEHPEVAVTVRNLASLYFTLGDYERARELARRATSIHRDRLQRNSSQRGSGLAEQKENRHVFLLHVQTLVGMLTSHPQERESLIGESFEVGQLAQATSAAAALASMAQRFGAGDDVLAAVVRARQDDIERWLEIDELQTEALSRPPEEREPEREKALRAEKIELDRRIADMDNRLATEFPEYSELAGSRPAALSDIQDLLAADEALLTFAVWDDRTFVWAVRKDRAKVHLVLIGREELLDGVAELRSSVDTTGGLSVDGLAPFNAALAHDLYRKLVAPATELLEGVGNVFVVADGALNSLPLGVLVTKSPARGLLKQPEDYRDVPWLAREFASTVLPSISSLRALRVFAARGQAASKTFVGFGDPALEGPSGAAAMRGADVGGVDAVLRLPPLPDTADELRAIAAAVGAGEGDLFLRERATESEVRTHSLADYRIVEFATHGLVSGELKGLEESALVLTPPGEATTADDGLLTASEIAQLELNADWVVLSACNTASGDGAGGEGLSGLAKAFFYAGSRALLVSHWPVSSGATVRLTTEMFSLTSADAEMGRAEALRRSMVALMEDADVTFAHPLYWAPFVVVGEGGSAL